MRKEDSQETTNALVAKELAILTNAVEEGFKGVHSRQDIANGRISKAEIDIIKLKSNIWYERAMGGLLTTLVGVVVYFITRT